MLERRFGKAGLLAFALGLVAVLCWGLQRDARRTLVEVERRLASDASVVKLPEDPRAESRSRVRVFETLLPPSDDIPQVLQDLLRLAEDEHLVLMRGDYHSQIDSAGGFLRYRMTLPIKGDSQAVLRFIRAALRAYPTLALESLQFSRERIDSGEIGARIQWVLMTHLPSAAKERS